MTDEILEKAQEIKNEQKVYNDILKKISESEQHIRLYSSTYRSDIYSEYIPEELIIEIEKFCKNKLKELEDEFNKL